VPELPADFPKHPIGTFAFVGAYAVVFVLLWYAKCVRRRQSRKHRDLRGRCLQSHGPCCSVVKQLAKSCRTT
jgi:hypothetical protein